VDELVALVQFVGVERPLYNHKTNYPIIFVDVPSMEVSSSLIRERLKTGKSVRYLLPKSVIDFIKECHLYGA
jgi:nicotinate-nucleotide adenylyltransferase